MAFDWGAAGGGAAIGLEQIIKQKLIEQVQRHEMAMAEARLAEQARQANQQNDIAQGQLSIGQGRLGLDRERFGQDVREYDEGAPMRVGQLRHMDAQTAELTRRPEKETSDRAHDVFMANLGDKLTRGQIVLRGQQDSSSMPGWSFKDYTDPTTNTTQTLRMNARTGAVEKVDVPQGLQPGGARQTRLTAGQQDDLATMETIEKMSADAVQRGNAIGWRGVGGLGAGTIGQLRMKHLGQGDQREEELRNVLGNVQGTIAKLRGGTAFSAQEKAMLDTYTPTINDSPKTIQAKLNSLGQFIRMKRESTMKYAGAPQQPGGAATEAPTLTWVPGKGWQ